MIANIHSLKLCSFCCIKNHLAKQLIKQSRPSHHYHLLWMLRHVSTHVPEPSRIYHSSQAKGDFSEFTWVQQKYVFSTISTTGISNQGFFLPDAILMPPVVVACDCVGRCLEILNIPSGEVFHLGAAPKVSEFAIKRQTRLLSIDHPNQPKYSDTVSETKEDDPFSQPTHHGYPILQAFPSTTPTRWAQKPATTWSFFPYKWSYKWISGILFTSK